MDDVTGGEEMQNIIEGHFSFAKEYKPRELTPMEKAQVIRAEVRFPVTVKKGLVSRSFQGVVMRVPAPPLRGRKERL